MALEVGTRLGHYHVTALIGEGGMGQVYQATDTKLNRQEALRRMAEVQRRFGSVRRDASVPDSGESRRTQFLNEKGEMRMRSRRDFVAAGLGSAVAIALQPDRMRLVAQGNAPALPAEQVEEFVRVAHGDLGRTKEMLDEESGLLNATWDWARAISRPG